MHFKGGKRGDILSKAMGSSSAQFMLVVSLAVVAALLGGGLLIGILRIASAHSPSSPQVLLEVPVTPMNQGVGVANNSPSLAADPTDRRFVALANRLDAPDFSCALQLSGDGGRGWVSAMPVPTLPPGADKCYAPEVAFDREGVLYYLFVGLQGTGNEPMGAFLTTSADRGQTFTPPERVLGPLNFAVRMAIDPSTGAKGRLHLVWIHATSDPPLGGFGPPPNPILTAHSDDGGKTFSEPVMVSDPNRELVVAPALALGADRHVHVAYYDLGDDVRDYKGLEGPVWEGTWTLIIASSADGGQKFGPGAVVDDAILPSERVMLVFTMPPPALVAGSAVCLAWTDSREGDPDAVLRCSEDHGRTWDRLRRLNDDLAGNGRSQYVPHLSMSDERLDVIFYDRRNDPESLRTDVYYTYSADSGTTFAPNLRVTQRTSDPRIGQQYVGAAAEGQVEFGSRLALLSLRDEALMAWTDTRNSRRGSTGQDLFATKVVLPGDGGQGGPAQAAGALLLGGGLLTLVVVALRRARAVRAAEQ